MTPVSVARVGSGRRPGAISVLGIGAWLLAAAPSLAAQTAARRVTGTVVDSAGRAVAGAVVRVMPAGVPRAVTDDSGRFAMERVPAGRVQFGVRRLGYAPDSVVVAVDSVGETVLQIRLSASAFALDTVMVTDTGASAWLRVFEERRRSGRGYYFTRADIVRAQPQQTTDLLRRVPGVSVVYGRWGPEVRFTHGGASGAPCAPQLYVHHVAHDGPVNDFSPDDIEAMEVYTGTSTVPIEFQSPVARSCGAIVIWTREPRVGR
jgi:Carboxypeptidase regulatory-like domain/TonB-dependent Receptor Plug Domain